MKVAGLAIKTNRIQNRLDELGKLKLEPKEYCQKWVTYPEDERGYRKACIVELHKVTGISKETIRCWGKEFEKAPDHVRVTLEQRDALNQIQEIMNRF